MPSQSEFEQKILEYLAQAYGYRSEDQIVAAVGGGNPYNAYRVRQTVWELVSEGRIRQMGPHMYGKLVHESSKRQIEEVQGIIEYHVVRVDQFRSVVRLTIISGPYDTREKAEESLSFATVKQPHEKFEIWSRAELRQARSNGIDVDILGEPL